MSTRSAQRIEMYHEAARYDYNIVDRLRDITDHVRWGLFSKQAYRVSPATITDSYDILDQKGRRSKNISPYSGICRINDRRTRVCKSAHWVDKRDYNMLHRRKK